MVYNVEEALAARTANNQAYFEALPAAVINSGVVTNAPLPPSQRGWRSTSYPPFNAEDVGQQAKTVLIRSAYPLHKDWSDPNPITNAVAAFIGTAPDGSTALEIRYAPGVIPQFVDAYIPFLPASGARHAGIRFEVWTPNTFDYGPNGSGGKLGGGLWGGGRSAVGLSVPWDDQNGMTLRNIWDQDADSLDARAYAYCINRAGSFPAGISTTQIPGKWELGLGRWQAQEYEGYLNTPGQTDGFGRFWIDDECIGEVTEAIWAINSDWRWRGIVISDAWQTGVINQEQKRWIRNLTFYEPRGMVNPLRIARQNLIDIATVTASSAIASLPVSNLQTDDIRELWRAGGTTVWILADLGSSREIGFTALMGSNLRLADGVRVRVSSTDTTGATGDAYDSGDVLATVDPVRGIFVHPIEPTVSGRYVRIDLSQAETVEAGRWMVGPVFSPSRNFSPGWEPLSDDPSRHIESLGQATLIDAKITREGMRFTLNGLTMVEADEIREMNRLNGRKKDILVCRNVDHTNPALVSIWGLMARTVTYPQQHPDIIESSVEASFEVWARL